MPSEALEEEAEANFVQDDGGPMHVEYHGFDIGAKEAELKQVMAELTGNVAWDMHEGRGESEM